ncbi:MAG TPA: hypothetical protein VLF89_04450 [Candidatus Saccharimonadales bacterium]|nr:hypothetical protein [Candidatus Saccharimonadales bacterium]
MSKSPDVGPRFHVGFSSLSAASTNPQDVLLAKYGTETSGDQIINLAEHLAKHFDDTSVSILPGRNLNLSRLAEKLAENNVCVSSIDIPDIQSIPKGIAYGFLNTIKGNINGAKSNLAWSLSNVGTEKQQSARTQESLDRFVPYDDSEQIVKANAAFWLRTPTQGEELDQLL